MRWGPDVSGPSAHCARGKSLRASWLTSELHIVRLDGRSGSPKCCYRDQNSPAQQELLIAPAVDWQVHRQPFTAGYSEALSAVASTSWLYFMYKSVDQTSKPRILSARWRSLSTSLFGIDHFLTVDFLQFKVIGIRTYLN